LTKADPIVGRFHILGFRVFVTFEILDPGVVDSHDEAWNYDLAWFQGLTLLQIRNLILDLGSPTKLLDPPAPPGTRTAPNPPPLRQRGVQVFQEWLDTQGSRGIQLPVSFTVP